MPRARTRAIVRAGRASFHVEGNIPAWLLDELRERYGKKLRVTEGEKRSAAVAIKESEWFEQTRKRVKPGDALRFYRENRGWSQEELGRMLGPGVRRQHVSNMEKGKRSISVRTARKLAVLFSTSVERFI